MGFSRQGCWSGLPRPLPGDLPNPGIEPGSPALHQPCLLSNILPSHHPPTSHTAPCIHVCDSCFLISVLVVWLSTPGLLLSSMPPCLSAGLGHSSRAVSCRLDCHCPVLWLCVTVEQLGCGSYELRGVVVLTVFKSL